MEIEIDFTKSAQENASMLFEKGKKLKKKAEGARLTISSLEKRVKEEKQKASASVKENALKVIEKREWYEKFHWFFTSSNMLAISGRDAKQNEVLNSKYFDENDLFFHADIFGASVTILKGGASADGKTKEEVAQFAACYSRGWGSGLSTLDVYALRRGQIKKSTNKGSLPTGSFAMSGEREWYRGMQLELVLFTKEEKGSQRLFTVPSKALSNGKPGACVTVKPGKTKKSDAAKIISKKLGFGDINYIMQQLPPGEFSIS